MSTTPHRFVSATPVLASLDVARTAAFYARVLDARVVCAQPAEYAIVTLGSVALHFWACTDPAIPPMTSCRVEVTGLEALFAQCQSWQAVHPNAGLRRQPWGTQEFTLLDGDGNCITFYEASAAASPAAT